MALCTMIKSRRGLVPRAMLIVAAGGFVAAGAADTRTSFTVSATVRAVATLERESAPPTLQISADDLRRGYLDVPQPLALVIKSNSPTGFAVDVATLEPVASAIVIHGLDGDVSLGADGGTIVQRWRRPQAVSLSLRIRLILAPGLAPGSYPWPMQLSVRPLESI